MRFRCYLCGETFPEAGAHGWVPHVLHGHPESLTARLILRSLVEADLPPAWGSTRGEVRPSPN